jgi:S-adenosylmethionine-diacylgycerolhomoserine-N-methlytransferase
LCRPLLEIAQKRIDQHPGWEKIVELVEGDATSPDVKGLPAPGTVDVITMSYSLTMIPDWQAALKNAYNLLRPGGYIAVSDFTIRPEHSAFTRTFWPTVFKNDHVILRTEHIDTLDRMFSRVHLQVERGGFPYVPLLKCPYYFYVGQKTQALNHK